MPKVSVIVPVYNVESYLERCMESLVNQTLDDIQIIAVNDGSTDNSGQLLSSYQEKYPEKVMILQKENGGLSDARNFGMPYAEGEYVAFLDSDDYVELDMYEKMYKKAKEEDSDMVECDFIWEYPNKKVIDTGVIYTNKHDMFVHARVVAWNKLIRRSIIEKAKIEYPKGLRYEDVEFFYKMLPYYNKVSFVKEPMIHYIQRGNSISNTQNEKTHDIFVILKDVLDYYRANGLFKEYESELEYTYARIVLCSSLKRISKIKNKDTRRRLQKETWIRLNGFFPNWKKNSILRNNKSKKNMYMKSINKLTYKMYCFLFKL